MSKIKSIIKSAPLWLIAFYLVGGIGMALAIVLVVKDLTRETQNLEELYKQKGEQILRSFAMLVRYEWIVNYSQDDLDKFRENPDNADISYLVITKPDGTIRATSPAKEFDPNIFKKQEPLEFFLNSWGPRVKISSTLEGKSTFWVYRPILSSYLPTVSERERNKRHEEFQRPKNNRRPQVSQEKQNGVLVLSEQSQTTDSAAGVQDQTLVFESSVQNQAASSAINTPSQASNSEASAQSQEADYAASALGQTPDSEAGEHNHEDETRTRRAPPPEWPPKDLRVTDKSIYCWVGFDMYPFSVALAAFKRKLILLVVLCVLLIIAFSMAIYRGLQFMRYHKLTNELIAKLPVGLLLNDYLGRVTIANQAAEKIIGLKQEHMKGKTLQELTYGTFPDSLELTGEEREVTFWGGQTARLSITCGP
ncbi:MAG: hypothetical protein LBV23_07060, partial [Deltaproteobacteria bacterium]|nr:hypothetical protein [Deltaproteobacteria bacterium]